MEQKVPESAESSAAAFIQRGDMLMDTKRYDDARVHYLNAIASDPQDAWAHCRLGVCCCMLGATAEAIEHGSKAVALMPDWADTHYQLAWIYNRIGEKYKAEQAACEALACEPSFAEAYVLLGWTFLDRNRQEEALDAVSRAIAIQPEDAESFNLQGIASLELGKLDDAQNSLTQALSLEAENPTSHANLGYVYLHRGEWQAAESHFRNALRLDPHFEYARLGVNEILRSRNPAFRWITRYRLWLDRQPEGFGWIVVFILLMIGYGFAFLFRVDTETGSWLLSMAPILLTFAVTGIFIEPISQTFACMSSAGRILATRWEAIGAVLLTLYLLFWSVTVIAGASLKTEFWQSAALIAGYAYLTFAQTWRSGPKWVRISMGVVSLMVVAMLVTIATVFIGEPTKEATEIAGVFGLTIFMLGLLSLLMPGYFYRLFYQPDG